MNSHIGFVRCFSVLLLFSFFSISFLTMESILFPGIILQELKDFDIYSLLKDSLNPFAQSYKPLFRLKASAIPYVPVSRLNPLAISYVPFTMNPFAKPYQPTVFINPFEGSYESFY